jgi:ankyrin repeat protein
MKTNIVWLILFVTLSAALISTIITSCTSQSVDVKLLNAAELGDLQTVKSLVEHGAQVNHVSSTQFGWTPLIGAIYFNQTNVVQYLAEAGADVNLASKNGNTPLMWASAWGDNGIIMVNCLISHGANLEAKDQFGATIFDYAESEPPKPKLIEVLKAAKLAQKNKTTSNSAASTNNTSQKPRY